MRVAIFSDLHANDYPRDRQLRKIEAMPLAPDIREHPRSLLLDACVPEARPI